MLNNCTTEVVAGDFQTKYKKERRQNAFITNVNCKRKSALTQHPFFLFSSEHRERTVNLCPQTASFAFV